MLTYVINLDRQPARMARMAEQLAGVAFERVPAVEGRELPGPERRLGEVPRTPEEITRYELAVTLSHKEAWRRFLESGAAWCCVLEDDVCLSPDFPEFMQGTDWLPGDASIVKIEMCGQRKRLLGEKKAVFMGRALMPLLSTHLGAAGYIIGRAAAKAILGRIAVVSRPIDHVLFEDLLCDKAFGIYQMVPALCTQERQITSADALSPDLQSTIQSKKRKSRLSLRQKAVREFKRPFVAVADAAAFVLSGGFAKGSFRHVGYR
jgi:glycosyl transferase family 25